MLLEVRNLKKYFPVEKSLIERITTRAKSFVHAVDNISFSIDKMELFGLVGESGCGKSTTGRLCIGLIEPNEGTVHFDGVKVTSSHKTEIKKLRRRMQMVFQDPNASLNPRMKIGEAVARPLRIQGGYTKQEIKQEVLRVLDIVALSPPESFYNRYPSELSGGQRQRAVIARSLVLKPEFVVADEPIAMVDVSVRAQIMDLIKTLRKEKHMTFLLITHDLASARYLCDRIAIMYAGKIVEIGSKNELFTNPQHPYTKALLSSAPIPDPNYRADRMIVGGEVPSLINPPNGCRFHPRCPFAEKTCHIEEPNLDKVSESHYVACIPKPFSNR